MAKTIDHRKTPINALKNRRAALFKMRYSPHVLRASYVIQWITCGKPNCRCRRGFKHGPFPYFVQCLEGGKVRKFLLKTKEQREQARAGIAAYAKFQKQLEELSDINTELLRRMGLPSE